MQILRDKPAQSLMPCVATIGNFDGLHLGHQAMIAKVVNQAVELGLSSTLITFEPLPQTILSTKVPFFRLMSFRQKASLLAKWGIMRLVCLRFTHDFSKLLPDQFAQDYLVDAFNVKQLMVGEDFRFGFQQAGDIQVLKQHVSVETLDLISDGQHRISSTAIREALIQGDCEKAALLLGRPYEIEHYVVHGQAQGRLLGFPTANLVLPKAQQILKGVFLCQAVVDGKNYYGLANMGTRPTLSGQHYLAEVHLLQFSGNLYGKRLKVSFLRKIRDEKRFDSLNALKQQIQQDIREVAHDCRL